MVTPHIRWTIFIGLALLALAVRLIDLGGRPMHTDEAVNAYIVGEVLDGGRYHYDPQDRHGPALAEIAVPLVRLQGAHHFADLTEAELRLAPALGGAAGVLIFGAAVEIFGFMPGLLGACLWAFAPWPLYYSRDFIHETFFVTGTFGLIVTGFWAFQNNSVGAAMLAGGCAAFMLACKETAGLHLAALALAGVLGNGWSAAPFAWKTFFPKRVWAAAVGTFLVTGVLWFSWGGQNWQTPLELGRAIPHLAARAAGEGHAKPFYYYFNLLAQGGSGALILLLGLIGLAQAGGPHGGRLNPGRRLIALYAGLIMIIYCVIPYKTPWLALNFWLPLTLLVGLAMEWLWGRRTNSAYRVVLFLVFAVGAGLMAQDTRHWVFQMPAEEKNPLAYAQTTEDILGLPPRVTQLSEQQGLVRPRVAVIAADPWPWPWYLRKFPQTGFWQPGQIPGPADFFITGSDVPASLMGTLKSFRPEFFGVRPNVLVILWSRPAATQPSP